MNRIGNLTRLIYTLLYMITIHTYIQRTYITDTVTCTVHFRLLPGHLGVVAGTLRGSLSPVRHGSVGVHLRDSVLYVRVLLLHAVLSYKLQCSTSHEAFFMGNGQKRVYPVIFRPNQDNA